MKDMKGRVKGIKKWAPSCLSPAPLPEPVAVPWVESAIKEDLYLDLVGLNTGKTLDPISEFHFLENSQVEESAAPYLQWATAWDQERDIHNKNWPHLQFAVAKNDIGNPNNLVCSAGDIILITSALQTAGAADPVYAGGVVRVKTPPAVGPLAAEAMAHISSMCAAKAECEKQLVQLGLAVSRAKNAVELLRPVAYEAGALDEYVGSFGDETADLVPSARAAVLEASDQCETAKDFAEDSLGASRSELNDITNNIEAARDLLAQIEDTSDDDGEVKTVGRAHVLMGHLKLEKASAETGKAAIDDNVKKTWAEVWKAETFGRWALLEKPTLLLGRCQGLPEQEAIKGIHIHSDFHETYTNALTSASVAANEIDEVLEKYPGWPPKTDDIVTVRRKGLLVRVDGRGDVPVRPSDTLVVMELRPPHTHVLVRQVTSIEVDEADDVRSPRALPDTCASGVKRRTEPWIVSEIERMASNNRRFKGAEVFECVLPENGDGTRRTLTTLEGIGLHDGQCFVRLHDGDGNDKAYWDICRATVPLVGEVAIGIFNSVDAAAATGASNEEAELAIESETGLPRAVQPAPKVQAALKAKAIEAKPESSSFPEMPPPLAIASVATNN